MMKTRLFSLCLLLTIGSNAQLTWTGPIEVDPSGVSSDNIRPRVVMTGGGVPLVMWNSAPDNTIYTARLNGLTFDTPVAVNPPNTEPFMSNWASTEIAAEGDTVFITYKTNPADQGKVYIQKSTDGGMTWGDTVRVENVGSDLTRFPSVAVGPQGNPVVAFMRFDPGWANPRYVVTNSTDGGQTFNTDVDASAIGGAEVCDCCPSHIYSEGNRQMLLFRNNDNNTRDMWLSVSQNNGATWNGADIDPNGWIVSVCPSSGADILVDGDSVAVVWMSGATGTNLANLVTANINDYQTGYETYVDSSVTTNQNQNYPKIDGNGDFLLSVFEQSNGGDNDAYYSFSDAGIPGMTLSKGFSLHQNTTGTQRNPDVAFHGGQFYVVYQDELTNTLEFFVITADNYTEVEEVVKPIYSVFPNPANDIVRVSAEDKVQEIIITDMAGRMVVKQSVEGYDHIIDVSDQQAGVYLLSVMFENGKRDATTIVITDH